MSKLFFFCSLRLWVGTGRIHPPLRGPNMIKFFLIGRESETAETTPHLERGGTHWWSLLGATFSAQVIRKVYFSWIVCLGVG